MKRGGGLKRTGGPGRRTALRRRDFKRRPKRRTELERREARAAIVFGTEVRRQARCQVCGYAGEFVEAHHVIGRQLLRRLLSQKGKPCPPETLHDPRNGLLLCGRYSPNNCHALHTAARRRIPRAVLRNENLDFARDHGLEWVIETEYPA